MEVCWVDDVFLKETFRMFFPIKGHMFKFSLDAAHSVALLSGILRPHYHTITRTKDVPVKVPVPIPAPPAAIITHVQNVPIHETRFWGMS